MTEWKDCGHCDSPAEHALHLKLHEVECRLFESERKLESESNRAERYEEALYRIAQWALAYPPRTSFSSRTLSALTRF